MRSVLLVGESTPLLRILTVVLEKEGFDVFVASDRMTLESAVGVQDLAIVDHIEPTDLFRLNPRLCGYSGRLLLLTERESAKAQELLDTDLVMLKPVDLHDLRQLVNRLIL